jgi:hypothetical protein
MLLTPEFGGGDGWDFMVSVLPSSVYLSYQGVSCSMDEANFGCLGIELFL